MIMIKWDNLLPPAPKPQASKRRYAMDMEAPHDKPIRGK